MLDLTPVSEAAERIAGYLTCCTLVGKKGELSPSSEGYHGQPRPTAIVHPRTDKNGFVGPVELVFASGQSVLLQPLPTSQFPDSHRAVPRTDSSGRCRRPPPSQSRCHQERQCSIPFLEQLPLERPSDQPADPKSGHRQPLRLLRHPARSPAPTAGHARLDHLGESRSLRRSWRDQDVEQEAWPSPGDDVSGGRSTPPTVGVAGLARQRQPQRLRVGRGAIADTTEPLDATLSRSGASR